MTLPSTDDSSKPTARPLWPVLALIVLFAQVACAADPPASAAAKANQRPVTAQDALIYFRKLDWPKTVEAYEQVLRSNPNNGQHWHNYGYALHALKRYDQAIQAAQKSIDLGYQPATGMYNIACADALMGKKEEALTWLEKSVNAGFIQDETLRTDSDLESLRGEPRFKALLGAPPEGLSREERWCHDLDYMVRRMERVHFNLYAKVPREKLQAAVNNLKSRVGSLTDSEIEVGIQRILAMVGDGHTSLRGRGQNQNVDVSRYPVSLFLYKEGLYVRGALPAYAEIVGAKVERIGKLSSEEALAAVEPLCSRDNAMGVKLASPGYLTNPSVLSFLKLTDDVSRVPVVLKKPNGEQVTIELKPISWNPSLAKDYVWANAGAKAPKPLSFMKNGDKFWFEHLPDKKLVYFQYNQVGDKPNETLEKFCGRLFAFINEHAVDYLVIDMRNNGGGNNFLNRPLVHGLIRCDRVNQPGHLFVLVGRRTFSAAMNGAVDIERNAHALFVGEPTGSSPNFVGETTILVLPCSGVRLSCSSLYWQSSTAMDRRTWIAPDLIAEPSIEAFAQNRDPGLEAIIEYITLQQTSKQ